MDPGEQEHPLPITKRRPFRVAAAVLVALLACCCVASGAFAWWLWGDLSKTQAAFAAADPYYLRAEAVAAPAFEVLPAISAEPSAPGAPERIARVRVALDDADREYEAARSRLAVLPETWWSRQTYEAGLDHADDANVQARELLDLLESPVDDPEERAEDIAELTRGIEAERHVAGVRIREAHEKAYMPWPLGEGGR